MMAWLDQGSFERSDHFVGVVLDGLSLGEEGFSLGVDYVVVGVYRFAARINEEAQHPRRAGFHSNLRSNPEQAQNQRTAAA